MSVDTPKVNDETKGSFRPKWRENPKGEGLQLTPETIREAWALFLQQSQKMRAIHEEQSPDSRDAMFEAFRCGVRAAEQIKGVFGIDYLIQREELAKGGAS